MIVKELMQTIYKYAFEINDDITIEMPSGAKILTVQEQNGIPCIWALVDTDIPKFPRRFILCGTGHDCSDLRICQANYIGTFQSEGGRYIWHLFEAR